MICGSGIQTGNSGHGLSLLHVTWIWGGGENSTNSTPMISSSTNGTITPFILVELDLDSIFWIYKDKCSLFYTLSYCSPVPISTQLHF